MSLLREVQGDIISGDVVHVTELVSAFVSIANGSGAQGFQGFQGAQGFQGFQGEPGQGSQGSQGTQGFQGEPGINGGGGGTMTTVADATDFYLTAFVPSIGIQLFSPIAMTFDPLLFGAAAYDEELVYGRVYFCSVRVPANVTITGAMLAPSESSTTTSSLYVGLYSPSKTIVAETILGPVSTGKKGFINKYPFDAPYVTPSAGIYTLAFRTALSTAGQIFYALNATLWQNTFVLAPQDNFTTPSTEIRVRCGYVNYNNTGVGSKFPAITSDTIIEQNTASIWAGLY